MKQRTVLIVDDDGAIRKMLARLFGLEGFQVLSAQDGGEALECFKQHHPDLVLLDYNLPGQNGLEVLEALKEVDPKVKVLLMTGAEDDTLPARAAQGGANFLGKPLVVSDLMRRTHLLLGA
jgi:DNA-binding response OmpR family regulator